MGAPGFFKRGFRKTWLHFRQNLSFRRATRWHFANFSYGDGAPLCLPVGTAPEPQAGNWNDKGSRVMPSAQLPTRGVSFRVGDALPAQLDLLQSVEYPNTL
jgi:hypothetical protein